VATAAAAAGAATVRFQIISSANADLSSPTIIEQSDAISKVSIVVGAQIVLPLPRSFINQIGQRYLGVQYTVGTGPLTAGAFDAFLLLNPSTSLPGVVYASGYSIK
jgi:hypothetical protein